MRSASKFVSFLAVSIAGGGCGTLLGLEDELEFSAGVDAGGNVAVADSSLEDARPTNDAPTVVAAPYCTERVLLDGGAAPQAEFPVATTTVAEIAVDDSFVYFTDRTLITRCTKREGACDVLAPLPLGEVVRAMAPFQGTLWITADGVTPGVSRIARWVNGTWLTVQNGLPAPLAINAANSRLSACGGLSLTSCAPDGTCTGRSLSEACVAVTASEFGASLVRSPTSVTLVPLGTSVPSLGALPPIPRLTATALASCWNNASNVACCRAFATLDCVVPFDDTLGGSGGGTPVTDVALTENEVLFAYAGTIYRAALVNVAPLTSIGEDAFGVFALDRESPERCVPTLYWVNQNKLVRRPL